MAPRDSHISDLVDANRILSGQGIFDAFGHISVRVAEDRFLLARNLAPGQVGPDDILEYSLDCEPVVAGGPSGYLERFIHSEIYRRRPDVDAVVHTHAPSLIVFGLVPEASLRPICHMSGFIGRGAPTFEIRDVAGDATDLLIRVPQLGRALAESLGTADIVLMRGHGATIVGQNVRQAVYRAIYAELNARLQLASIGLGEPIYLTAAEADAAADATEAQVDRPWRIWCEAVHCTSKTDKPKSGP